MRLLLKSINIFLLAFVLAAGTANSQNPDIDILRDINLHRDKNLDGTFKFISKSAIYPEVAIPVAFITIGLIKKDKVMRDKGFEMGATMLLGVLATTSLKYAVHRQRPFASYPELEKLSSPRDPSFPSGHSSASFALATTLSLNLPKWYVIAPAYLWASAVAYSRMDMGVHYPTDVVAGIIIGSGSAVLSHYLNKQLHKPKKKKVVPLD